MSSEPNAFKRSSYITDLVQIICAQLPESKRQNLEEYAFGIAARMAYSNTSSTDSFVLMENVKLALASEGKIRESVLVSELFTRLNGLSSRLPCSPSVLLEFLCKLGSKTSAVKFKTISPVNSEASEALGTARRSNSTNSFKSLTPAIPHSSSTSNMAVVQRPNNLQLKQTPGLNDERSTTVREILYALQGIPGNSVDYVLYQDRFLLSRHCKVSESFATHANKICSMGWLYIKIRKFIDSKSADKTYGLIGQSLCSALQGELSEFDRLIAAIESQVVQDRDVSVNTGESVTLCQLDVWLYDAYHRFKMILSLVENCRNKKGGALLTCVHSFTQHGDPEVKSTMKRILKLMLHPLLSMILSWLTFGELVDDYSEFFISAKPEVKPEKLWHEKYWVNLQMLPVFIPEPLANKMLLVGKSINFISQVCKERYLEEKETDLTDSSKRMESNMRDLEENFEGNLTKLVTERQTSINGQVLQLLMHKYKFVHHLKAFRRYLLFGQGDFIRHLMDILGVELDKPATELFKHSLTSSLETAIRATNAQFDDAEILERLDVRLLEWSPGDKGWDVFSLHYHVSGGGPLSTVFTNQCVLLYLRIFNFLWRSKRIEFVLSQMWIEQISYVRLLRDLGRPVQAVLHKCKMLHGNMMNFVLQMQYYLMFEVLECSWAQLLENVNKSPNLDHIIAAHQTFLDTIISGALLEQDLHFILSQIRAIFDIIVQYQQMQSRFFDAALTVASLAETKESAGSKMKSFNKETLPKLRAELKIVSTSFKDAVTNLLLSLLSQPNELLQSLAYRLDFNDFYKNKDARLKQSYKHMRIAGR